MGSLRIAGSTEGWLRGDTCKRKGRGSRQSVGRPLPIQWGVPGQRLPLRGIPRWAELARPFHPHPAQSLAVTTPRRTWPLLRSRKKEQLELTPHSCICRELWEEHLPVCHTRVYNIYHHHSIILHCFILVIVVFASLTSSTFTCHGYARVLNFGSSFVCLDFLSNISFKKDSRVLYSWTLLYSRMSDFCFLPDGPLG